MCEKAKVIAVCSECGNNITTFEDGYYYIFQKYICENCIREAKKYTESWEE